VLKRLEGLAHLEAHGVGGESWRAILSRAGEPGAVVRSVDNPISRKPSVVVMRGNLAPDGSILKLGNADAKAPVFRGNARVFRSQDDALAALKQGEMTPGTVAVLRGMGPRGGPGMALASGFVSAVDGAGLSASVAVITDGQLSGLNRGIAVGQISPEAAMGGLIWLVEDGDSICIDVEQRSLTLEVDDAVIAARRAQAAEFRPADERGWLSIYARTVGPMGQGAVLLNRDR
jgi:dihydroxy-acid dehydratase